MKKLLIVFICLISLIGCGKQGPAGANGKDGKDGSAGAQGPAGKDGMGGGIYKVKTIPHSNTDLCSYSEMLCVFNGGQIVYFEDGSILLTASYSYFYYDGYNVDKDQHSISLVVEKVLDFGWVRLDFAHEQSGTLGPLYMVFNKVDDKIYLVSDTDGSNSLTEDDDTILTLTPY
jgi:hypothetical protein